MNILYLLFSFTVGGTERLVADICNEMARRDHNVHLYVVNDLCDQSMLDSLAPNIHVYTQGRPAGGGEKLKTLLSVAGYIRKNKIDVVHCNSFSSPELLLLKPLLFPKTRIIHTVHDVGQYAGLGKIKCWIRNWLCYRFVAISDCVKEDILAHGAKKDKVQVVYNAIDLSRFYPRHKQQSNTLHIGQVARFMPEKKGQDLLVKAMGELHKKYPNILCSFAGDADAEHREAFEKIKKTVEQAGLGECVTFLGNVDDVPAFLATIDVFVLPSRYEGFGISLIEAMAMGIPCVASRLDGPAEVLQGGKYGTLFTPDDSDDLAQKLEAVLEDLPAKKEAAIQNISYVKETYNIITMCDRLEELMFQ